MLRGRDTTLPLAVLLVFPTIGLEQLLHTSLPALGALPLYQALHWLSDSLLALPLGVIAVWGGQRLAGWFGLGGSTSSDIVARAGLVAVVFALTLVPGGALHDEADRLTHVHSTLSIHSHVPLAPQASVDQASVANFVVHGLGDGLVGQAIGLPLMILAMWEIQKQRARSPRVVALAKEEVKRKTCRLGERSFS